MLSSSSPEDDDESDSPSANVKSKIGSGTAPSSGFGLTESASPDVDGLLVLSVHSSTLSPLKFVSLSALDGDVDRDDGE